MEKTVLTDRIKQVQEKIPGRAMDFIDRIGCKKSTYYDYVNGDKDSPGVLYNIIEAFPEISMEWLFRGKGTMFLDGRDSLPDGIPNITIPPRTKYNPDLNCDLQTLAEEPIDIDLLNTSPDDAEDLLTLCSRQQKLLNLLYIKLGEYRGQLQLYKEFVKQINANRTANK